MAEEVMEVNAGEVIVEEGSSSSHMFVVGTGKVEVWRRHAQTRVVLATLGPGAIFGELGLLESLPRGASVTAKEDSKILVVDSAALLSRIAADPMFALKLLQTMSARVRRLTEELYNMAVETQLPEEDVRDKVAEIEHGNPGYL